LESFPYPKAGRSSDKNLKGQLFAMKNIPQTPRQILNRYYQITYPEKLGISFPINTDVEPASERLAEYAKKNLAKSDAHLVRTQLEQYYTSIAPALKTEPLLDFLNNDITCPHCMIDFGCGSGHIIRYLAKRISSLRGAWGIDTDISALPHWEQNSDDPPTNSWRTRLEELETDQSYDLAIAIHSLHHLASEEQVRVLSQLFSLLRPGGLLYLYEDSWSSANRFSRSTLPELDYAFSMLEDEDKKRIFQLNEHRSNIWTYGRLFPITRLSYRSLEGWSALLVPIGLEIVKSGTTGFDSRRLHGVPAAWLIARKT
jgi:SAM-dependent methyltransferase